MHERVCKSDQGGSQQTACPLCCSDSTDDAALPVLLPSPPPAHLLTLFLSHTHLWSHPSFLSLPHVHFPSLSFYLARFCPASLPFFFSFHTVTLTPSLPPYFVSLRLPPSTFLTLCYSFISNTMSVRKPSLGEGKILMY